MAYLIGPKKVEWTPIANKASSSSGTLCSSRPAAPATMMMISAVLTMRMMHALSPASASWPASADSRKKGRMNSPPAIALNAASWVCVAVDAVDDQHDHRRAEQIVVERAEELGRENRQEAPRAQQMDGVLHG